MAMCIHVDIVSAEQAIFSGLAEMVFATGALGELGIGHGHAQLLTSLRPGEIRIRKQNGEEDTFFVTGGLLEVQPEIVTVLADTATRAADIDEAEAIQARERVEKLLAEQKTDFNYSAALKELAIATAQIRAIKKMRDKHQ
ncbi:MAG: F0F1 ATP synthase subunit epsilon [Gammaproteobacteria bacterium]